MESFDIIIIGAGSGGLTAAEFGVQLGARVALVEKGRIGGDCTWTGCVPSKALLQVARVAHQVRTAGEYGVQAGEPVVNMFQVRAYVQRAVQQIYAHETPEALAQKGIELVMGEASFVDGHTIHVGERKLTAANFIIATGAKPFIPPVTGLDGVRYVTYEQIFENETLPASLLVLGGGPVGVEVAQAYARLGSQVTVIDVELLPRVEPEARDVLRRVFAREGIRVVQGLVTAVSRQEDEIVAMVDRKENGQTEVVGQMLLVAAGRRPTVAGLDLEQAGVTYSEKGIEVDDMLRTSRQHIYAVGDCTGGFQFTHVAGWQGFQAVRNALLPGSSQGVRETPPQTTFTDPAVARVGLTEAEARQRYGAQVHISQIKNARIDRAVTDNDQDGFIKIVYHENGRVLGATVVAAHAGDVIIEFSLAMAHGLKMRELAETMHVYPTYGTAVQLLTGNVAAESFLNSIVGKLATKLAGLQPG